MKKEIETMRATQVTPLEEWPIWRHRPLVIAGPCSAESEEQVMATATALARSGRTDIFRAGVWKPRTRPGQFEGVGLPALRWLRRVREELGLPVAVEVANKKHVCEALRHGIDALWIGARTSVSPFALNEIAAALRNSDVMVFVKNPVNPDLELWTGALERISRAGISRLAAIHRGFSTCDKSLFRNQPHWEIALELRHRFPEVGMICDPSHMGGDRRFIGKLSQKALDLNYDGVMIEAHIDPDSALSDSRQQVTPDELENIVEQLVTATVSDEKNTLRETIERLRGQIDILDIQLLDLLQGRMQVAEAIGHYKKMHNITILQSQRWKEIRSNIVEQGVRKGLDAGFISTILEAIHNESIAHQVNVMKDR